MSNDLYFPIEYTIVSRTRSLISQIRYMPHDKIQKKRGKKGERVIYFPPFRATISSSGAKLGQNLLTRDLFTSDN